MYHNVKMTFNGKPIYECTSDEIDRFYTEAVFSGGKGTVEPLLEKISAIKEVLDNEIECNGDKFDPTKFWKNDVFKSLEHTIKKIFGFNNVSINPYIERYDSKSKMFESKIMNCKVCSYHRYFILGLVDDKGFYDSTHSADMFIYVTLGLLKSLTSEEILAVFLHEFGHCIDPAMCDIGYLGVNTLAKYLTERNPRLNKSEQKYVKHLNSKFKKSPFTAMLCAVVDKGKTLIDRIKSLFNIDDTKTIQKIQQQVANDKEVFNRISFGEAYADNFARMYGYGAILSRALSKLAKSDADLVNKYISRESRRRKYIIDVVNNSLKGEHRTEIHRFRALLKEYDTDIKDPNIPPQVKKNLKEDRDLLEKVLDQYLNNFSELQNRINKIINDELSKKDGLITDHWKHAETEKNKHKDNGSEDNGDSDSKGFTESKSGHDKLMKWKESLSKEERAEVRKKFGNSNMCSFAKDKDGYFCFTHRARSKSYSSIGEIPQKDVDFVRSTS